MHVHEKATAEEEMPIFGEVGQGFTFTPKIVWFGLVWGSL